MSNFLNKFTYDEKRDLLRRGFLITLGAILLAFGTAIFLTKLTIVTGGLSGIAIIIQKFVGDSFNVIDIVVWAGNIIFWFIGLFILGKKFAFRTLLASLLYPAFLTLFTRVPIFIEWANDIAGKGELSNILLCSIFSGVLVGTGMSLTFLGGGSTGGFDTLLMIGEKYFRIKSSISSIVFDGTIILVSMFAIKDNVVNSLCGILSALLVSLIIEVVYLGNQSSLQVDIISDNYEAISLFVQNKLGRGATIIRAEGGYKGEERVILRVVIDKKQGRELKEFIALVDPKAFVTFTQTNAVYGEGFTPNTKHRKIKKK